MKVRELLERLAPYDPDTEIMVLDGFNGGGLPRTINLGPMSRQITSDYAREVADCEGLVGKDVLVVGYGCY